MSHRRVVAQPSSLNRSVSQLASTSAVFFKAQRQQSKSTQSATRCAQKDQAGPSWPLTRTRGVTRYYYPGQKNRYSRDIHEIDPQCDHVIYRDIDFNLQRDLAIATRRYIDTASRVDVEPKLGIARYHMIRLSINLMNFSAVTIFLAGVVDTVTLGLFRDKTKAEAFNVFRFFTSTIMAILVTQ